MAFAAVVVGNIGLILSNRSQKIGLAETLRRPNRVLWWIVGGALLGLALALYVEPMREIFRFAPLDATQLLMSFAAVAIGLAGPELYKALRRGRARSGRASTRGASS
jgi:Ca2+-transporting ATPase